jgi:uncharacterized membrane protein YkvA (DUF1232 family)
MDISFDKTLPGLRRVFDRTLAAAQKVMRRRVRLILLVRNTYVRLGRHENIVGQFRADLVLLLRLVKAWTLGQYRAVPWKSVLYAVAAMLYFMNPIDLIPDAIVGIGFLDDAAVAAAVVRSIHNDLQEFRRWEEAVAAGDPAVAAIETSGTTSDRDDDPD